MTGPHTNRITASLTRDSSRFFAPSYVGRGRSLAHQCLYCPFPEQCIANNGGVIYPLSQGRRRRLRRIEYHNPDRKLRIVPKCSFSLSLALSHPPSLLKGKSTVCFPPQTYHLPLLGSLRCICISASSIAAAAGHESWKSFIQRGFVPSSSSSDLPAGVPTWRNNCNCGGGRVSAGNLLDYFQ